MASGQTSEQNYIENPNLRLFSSCSINHFKELFLKNGYVSLLKRHFFVFLHFLMIFTIFTFQSVFDSSFDCLKNTVDKVNVDKKTRLFNAEDECNSPYGQNTPFCKVEFPFFISTRTD